MLKPVGISSYQDPLIRITSMVRVLDLLLNYTAIRCIVSTSADRC